MGIADYIYEVPVKKKIYIYKEHLFNVIVKLYNYFNLYHRSNSINIYINDHWIDNLSYHNIELHVKTFAKLQSKITRRGWILGARIEFNVTKLCNAGKDLNISNKVLNLEYNHVKLEVHLVL